MTTCLVTGGAGFVGSHLVEALLARGDKVRVLDNLSTGKKTNLEPVLDRIEFHQASVIDRSALAELVHGVDTIYHLAAEPSVQRSVEDPVSCHEVCATGTLNVLDAARRAGVRRLIYAASSSAYGDAPGAVRTEEDPLTPLSPYAAAKLAGEMYCICSTAVYGLETVRLRFFNIFGPRQDAASPYSGVIALFVAAMTQGRQPTIYGDGMQSRDFVFVSDAVQALLKAAQSPNALGRVYNIGHGSRISVLDLVRNLNELLGTSIEPVHGPARPGDIRHSQADITRARRELGYEPAVPFIEGLRRTLDWYRSGVCPSGSKA